MVYSSTQRHLAVSKNFGDHRSDRQTGGSITPQEKGLGVNQKLDPVLPLSPTERLQRVFALGKGLLLLIFSKETSTHSVVSCSPISISNQGRLLFVVYWHPDFSEDIFDDRY